MKTISKVLTVQEAVTIAKPFVSKKSSRPILQAALITKDHVIATDSFTLIKLNIENEGNNRLHHYTNDTKYLDAASYPNTDRLLPDPYNAQVSFTINVAEWIEVHDLALVAAKEHNTKTVKNNPVILQGNKIIVKSTGSYNEIGFTYTLDTPTPIENVVYNAKYMLQVLKAAKKLKQTEVTMHYYGPMRPILFTAGPMSALVLPIRLV